jgi:hypothetical protein
LKKRFLYNEETVKLLIAVILAPLLLADIPPPRIAPPLSKSPITPIQKNHSGQWYMSEDGHAVFCYGPQATVIGPRGEIIKIITFCRDGRAVVRLKD